MKQGFQGLCLVDDDDVCFRQDFVEELDPVFQQWVVLYGLITECLVVDTFGEVVDKCGVRHTSERHHSSDHDMPDSKLLNSYQIQCNSIHHCCYESRQYLLQKKNTKTPTKVSKIPEKKCNYVLVKLTDLLCSPCTLKKPAQVFSCYFVVCANSDHPLDLIPWRVWGCKCTLQWAMEAETKLFVLTVALVLNTYLKCVLKEIEAAVIIHSNADQSNWFVQMLLCQYASSYQSLQMIHLLI